MGRSLIISSNSTAFINLKLTQIRTDLGITEQDHSDQLLITVPDGKQSIGVKEMQQLRSWSVTKPYRAKYKLGIILQAELLTSEAQNSVLKLLEEPNDSCSFVLVTGNYSKLLPTVISRCELQLDSKDSEAIYDISEFLSGDTLDKFKFIAKFTKIESPAEKNQQIEAFLLSLLTYFRGQLLLAADADNEGELAARIATNIALINQTQKMLAAKVPSRNCLENLLINLKFL